MAAENRTLSLKPESNLGSLPNDQVELAVRALQEDSGRLSKLLALTLALGRFHPTPAQCEDIKERLADIFTCLARICAETALLMETLTAATPAAQLTARLEDPATHIP